MVTNFDYEYCKVSADYLLSRIGFVPELAIVLGTGCGPFAAKIQNPVTIPYEEIPNFLISTNHSHAGKMVAGTVCGKKVICMNGRFHFYEGYTFEELSIPVHVFKAMGIEKLVLTNASGAVNTSYKPGDVMIISDHIKLYGGSPLRGANDQNLGNRFFDVSDMYTRSLRKVALEAAKTTKLNVHEGIYMFFPGPQFETPAEIRVARFLGADAIGMSTVTEALTAAHSGIKLLGIALITNMAAGITADALDGNEVDLTAQMVADEFSSYLESIVDLI